MWPSAPRSTAYGREEIVRDGIEDHLDRVVMARTRAAEVGGVEALRRIADQL
jgi:hypothetical protein